MRLLLLGLILLASCDPFAPYENPTRTVEGCSEAVDHLRQCCPAWDSYLSCTYFDNAVALPDLTASQSSCLRRKSCEEIERAISRGSRLCDYLPSTQHCR